MCPESRKSPGNWLYQIGATKNELGGSHLHMLGGVESGSVPQVDVETAKRTFAAVYEAIGQDLIRACHGGRNFDLPTFRTST